MMWRRKLLNVITYYGKVNNINYARLIASKCKHTLSVHEIQDKIKEDGLKSQHFNSFTYRTHTCGELRSIHNGERVTLCGWVQYVRLSKFLLLRDSYGTTQCINNSDQLDISNIPLESVVKIDGKVALRPTTMINNKMETGEIEINIEKLEILNKADKVPFNLRDYQKPKEQLRLQHRYIDLRFPEMQSNLRQRSLLLHNMRKLLVEKHGFVEVETPTLFCRTPGGAREFVVPTHHTGLFYSLVQSPQQFKQMLMVGGIDRYFQIARCYRDEATRPDRQPEFTQLDIEQSFTNLDNIITLIEQLLYETFLLQQLPKPPFKRMTYKYAMENYGTDKPNVTYEMKLINLKNLFDKNNESMSSNIFALPYPKIVGKLTAKYKDIIKELKKKHNVIIIFNENISKDMSTDINNQIQNIIGDNNSAVLAIGDNENVCLCLGEIRELLAVLLRSKDLLKVVSHFEPLWVVDFPLFVKGDNGLETCHHPFTAPHPDDVWMIDTEPLKVRSLAYDIVLNGNEIGGGSVRVHDANLQAKLLKMLNIDVDKLTHFLNALKSGCPPHAGIALGIDRLMSIACGAESIRDVIAFPKSHEGKDPLSGAPNLITEDDKKYYHINIVK